MSPRRLEGELPLRTIRPDPSGEVSREETLPRMIPFFTETQYGWLVKYARENGKPIQIGETVVTYHLSIAHVFTRLENGYYYKNHDKVYQTPV